VTIYYVTNGGWGTGTGAPLAAAQVDGNFWDVNQRIVTLTSDLAVGKRINFVTYTNTSMTFHYTDSTTQTIPLPVMHMNYVGSWMPLTPYVIGNLFSEGNGFYQVLENHTSAATFDPNATDGTTAHNPLYSLWSPLYSTLDSLTDVAISTGLTVGDVLAWNGANWDRHTPGVPSLTLNDLTDVVISSPANGQVVIWNGANWINGTSTSILDNLGDVTITAPVAGQPLIFDGSGWINKSVADLPISNLGSVSGTVTLNLQTNEFVRIQLSGNLTIGGFNWPSSSSGQFVRRVVEIKDAGTFTLSWPSVVKWAGGTVPVLTTGGTDVFVLYTYDSGASVYGNVVGQGYS